MGFGLSWEVAEKAVLRSSRDQGSQLSSTACARAICRTSESQLPILGRRSWTLRESLRPL
jgi:hypothetical protein